MFFFEKYTKGGFLPPNKNDDSFRQVCVSEFRYITPVKFENDRIVIGDVVSWTNDGYAIKFADNTNPPIGVCVGKVKDGRILLQLNGIIHG